MIKYTVMLRFKSVELSDKLLVNKYLYKYGENSCQHSFAAMFCNKVKYNDSIYEEDGYLFILRANRCTEKERLYLFPMGDTENKETLKNAIQKILDDAHFYNKKVCFSTLTLNARNLLHELFPNKFEEENNRDYYEYIYNYATLANLSGSSLSSKRYDLQTFFRDYKGRVRERILKIDDIDDIKKFQYEWLYEKTKGEEDVQLELENETINVGLSNYKELGFSGIVVFIDDKMAGYAYGTEISDTAYDVFIEKGDRKFPDIYKVLNRDLVRLCCRKYKYINREEDVGVVGLRKAKMSYKPDMMIAKYIEREV